MKIVVAGNCQAMPIAKIIEECVNDVQVSHYIVHEATNQTAENFRRDVIEADYVLSFRVSNEFKVESFRFNKLKELAGDKLHTITNLFFTGYHPDYTYVNKLEGGRLTSFLGDYHSKICLIGTLVGASPSVIRAAMLEEDFGARAGYKELFAKSSNELLRRDKNIDIGYAKKLLGKIDSSPLFLTFNHPNNFVFYDYTYTVLDHLGISYKTVLPSARPEFLGRGPVLAMHPSINNLLNFNAGVDENSFVKPGMSGFFVDINEFIERSIEDYSKLKGPLVTQILEKEWAKPIVNAMGVAL